MFSDRIDETTAHELDVIDAIVRGGGEARPEDAALTDFALLVRNARPMLDHGAAAALDERSASAQKPRKPREGFIFKPAVAGVCGLVVLLGAAGVVTAIKSAQSGEVISAISAAPKESALNTAESPLAEDGMKKAPASTADMAQSAAGTGSGTSTGELEPPIAAQLPESITSAKVDREVARDTRITLAADGSEIERISDRVTAIVDAQGGYIASSKVSGGEGDRGRATFDLMIPATNYKAALAQISKLAHVRSRSQQSQDITTEVNSAERNLKRWTARVNRLEDQLAAAETTQQRIILRRQLAAANAGKRVATRQVRANRARVNYVPIALTIVADKSAADKDKGAIAKAFDQAGKILTGIAAVLIIALAVLIPVGLIGAALWFGIRRWNRTRSERTIDAAAAPQPE